MMHSFNIFLQKINVKPSLQKPNSVGALQRITFILILWLNPTTYMRSYWLVSFAGHYVLPFDGVPKEMNSVKNVWIYIKIFTRAVEARATLQNSTYSKRSKCFTLHIVTLSLFSSMTSHTFRVSPPWNTFTGLNIWNLKK